MILVYNILELGLLSAYFFRLAINARQGQIFNVNYIEVLLFLIIWMMNSLLGLVAHSHTLAFYFVHCAFPITLILCILFKDKTVYLYLSMIVLVAFNLYLKNSFIIIVSYWISFILMFWQLIVFSKKTKKIRSISFVYSFMLMTLVLCNLIFVLGIEKINWIESQYVKYILFICIFICMSTILVSHITLPMFLKSNIKKKSIATLS